VPFELRLMTITQTVPNADPNRAQYPSMITAYKNPAVPPVQDTADPAVQIGRVFDAIGVKPAPNDYVAGNCRYDPIPFGLDTTGTSFAGISARVDDPNPHPNYGVIGNDPPNEAVLTGVTASEQVLCRYIDPDDVHGTCIRLENPNGVPAYANAMPAPTEGNGPFRYNGSAPLPRRAVVSVAVRFRNNKRIPFQFNTQTMEVSLEKLVQFQSLDRRIR
jgi:hypothetical protein